jgi:tight adherence protein B
MSPNRFRGRHRNQLRLAALLVTVGLSTVSAPAFADGGSIDHVDSSGGKFRVLYSLPDAGTARPDLGSLKVTLNHKPVDATAVLASDATNAVRRTAVLAVDVSSSMAANGKFEEAKRAAQLFIDSAPADLHIGVVTFANDVTVAQEPALDRAATTAVIKNLKLSRSTRLYDGLTQAVTSAGRTGQRNVIVLSDGRDTSTTKLANVTAAVKKADVKVDVVALDQSQRDEELLTPLAAAGGGTVISARDPKALSQVFASEAQDLASQVQVTGSTPSDVTEGSLEVSIDADGRTYSDSAFVSLSEAKPDVAPAPVPAKLTAAEPGLSITPTMMLGGLAALGLGLLVILLGLFGGLSGKRKQSLESRIDVYTRRSAGQRTAPPAEPQGVAAQAVDLATKALETNKGFEVKLSKKLEAGSLPFRPAEWLLLHAAVAFGASAVVFMLSGGSLVMAGAGWLGGALLAWMYLGFKASRRLKAFNAQLAGTLQLMAGSLQAGLSFAQGMDTIVREGAEPVAGEFRRALVETRLGVTIEDALDGIADRMSSDDFRWTVMAIRIQREVGGNLAELLLSVAGTLRERDYLRRQVKSLSAEGRFSAYILLALPPGVMLYEYMTNRSYLMPLFTTSMGYVLLAVMIGLMFIGGFMMKRMIKLEI